MRTKALWFLLIMTVSLTLTLACGAADEPAAESPGPPSPGVAQTTDAMTPAGSSESAGGAAGAETTGTSSPRTDNSSMPLTANPATGSQGTVPGQPAGQQQTTESPNTATNPGSVPAATLPPTPIPCEVLAGAMWLSEDFWMSADATQVTAALDCGATVLAKDQQERMALHLASQHSEDPAVIQVLGRIDNWVKLG